MTESSEASSPQHDLNPHDVQPWSAERLMSVSPQTVELSCGFLRCLPEKWFPGFFLQWGPLIQSLGVEIEVKEVSPTIPNESSFEIGFAGTVDGVPIALCADKKSVVTLTYAVGHSSEQVSRDVIAEYLARRFLGSLALSWTGPDPSPIYFDSELNAKHIRGYGVVELILSVDHNPVTLSVLLGKEIVTRLDGLWKRQLVSSTKTFHPPKGPLTIEIASVLLPSASVSEYMQAGTLLDLEVPLSDIVILRDGETPILKARLIRMEENFALEYIEAFSEAIPQSSQPLSDSSTRISVELGTVSLGPAALTEFSQAGAMIDTGIALTNSVNLNLGASHVIPATLSVFEGRFAVKI